MNCNRRLAGIGVMFTQTPAKSSPEGARVWGCSYTHSKASRRLPMEAHFHTAHREPKNEREYTNRHSAKYICLSGKSPIRMSQQTNPPIHIPLLQIQLSTIDKCILVRYRILMHQPVHCNLQIMLRTRIYHKGGV